MSPEATGAAAAFAVVWITLHTGHHVGDYWIQTHHQACTKGQRGWAGRLACSRHVATLTAAQVALLAVAAAVLHLDLAIVPVLFGLSVNAASHWWADRRTTLLGLAELLERHAGKATFARLGTPRPGRDDLPTLGTGAAALDQAWHTGWLMLAALLITG
jgi:hypothetical protein